MHTVNSSSRTNRSGFTLIELLVVIAIIAILASILFPVFAQAKLAAKKAADLSNTKQICTSTFIYNVDYDDVLPTIRNSPSAWVGGGYMSSGQMTPDHFQIPSLVEQLAPYVKNHAIWASPQDTLSHCTSTGGKVFTSTQDTGGPVDYIPTYNGQQNVITAPAGVNPVTALPESYGIFGMPWTGNSIQTGSLTATQIPTPANTIAFAPMFITWSNYTGIIQQRTDQRQFAFKEIIPDFPQIASCPYCWCAATDGLSMENFSGVANWTFADGHAKSMPRTQTMDRLWYTDPNTAITNFAKNLFNANAGYN